ncbi:MAG: fructose 1,6-bisphosphatase [Candidatus Spechtbacteria bacterium]|nr:fructose 1,6-bisphosphatase [Candidatus Spechtbacteria bacterium]
MKLTLSVIKADVGSIGGHTKPSEAMLAVIKSRMKEAEARGDIIDSFVSYTGDDIAILMSHAKGAGHELIHQLAWNSFVEATHIAQNRGLYAAGQDLLKDAPAGNVRGAGPAVAEIEFEHNPVKENKIRPAESFMLFAADKCGPGAYNLPFFLSFADPMYCSGLMLPKMIGGFTFRIIDMDCVDGDRVIDLTAPQDYYRIVSLLRDNERFAIESIYSKTHQEICASISAQRLHNIAGTYTGKDDPVAIIRTQGIFSAPEEILSPFTMAHYVGGDARGSHNMPLMPVPLNTQVSGAYCLPIVSSIGFSVDKEGSFFRNGEYIDFFDNVAWDQVRVKAQEKAMAIRAQGWSGIAMLPTKELEYGGFRETLADIDKLFYIK